MGCFNHIGFHSNLPITYGDEIVLIIGFKYNNIKQDNHYVYPTDKFMPLFLPIKGKYDDYGGIEDYDKEITDKIEEITQVKFDKLIRAIDSHCANISLKDISEEKKTENTIYKNYLETYEKALISITNNIRNSDSSVYTKYYDLESLSISYTMERYDVYHKIASLFDWYLQDSNIDKLFKLRDTFQSKGFILDEHKMTMDILNDMDSLKLKENLDNMSEEEVLSNIKKWEDKRQSIREISKICLNLRVGNSSELCRGYNGFRVNELLLKDKIKEFLCFNFGLYYMCGVYRHSPTAHQDVGRKLNEVKILNSFYQEILNNF